MTDCTHKIISFPALKRRRIETEFTGEDITSDAGALLLREVDRRLGLFKAVDQAIPDERDQYYVHHSLKPAKTTGLWSDMRVGGSQ